MVSVVSIAAGCSLAFDAGTLGVKVSMAENAGQPPRGTEFQVTKKAVFLFFGVLTASNPSLENVLAGQLLDASEVQNLEIRVRSRFPDILVSVLTAGLIVPRSVTFHGYVVSGDGGSTP
jgi:hypothetical protein